MPLPPEAALFPSTRLSPKLPLLTERRTMLGPMSKDTSILSAPAWRAPFASASFRQGSRIYEDVDRDSARVPMYIEAHAADREAPANLLERLQSVHPSGSEPMHRGSQNLQSVRDAALGLVQHLLGLGIPRGPEPPVGLERQMRGGQLVAGVVVQIPGDPRSLRRLRHSRGSDVGGQQLRFQAFEIVAFAPIAVRVVSGGFQLLRP